MRALREILDLRKWVPALRLAGMAAFAVAAPAVGVALGSVLSGVPPREVPSGAVAAGTLLGVCAVVLRLRHLPVRPSVAISAVAAVVLAGLASWLQGAAAGAAAIAVWLGHKQRLKAVALPAYAGLVVMVGTSPAGSVGPVVFAGALALLLAFARVQLDGRPLRRELVAGLVCLVLVLAPLPFFLFDFRGLYLLLLLVADGLLLSVLWLLLAERAPKRARGMLSLAMVAMAAALYFGAIVQLGE